MTDKVTASEQKARGEEAKLIVEHPLFIQAFDQISSDLHRIWAESHTDEHDKRHNAYLMQAMLPLIKKQFVQWIVEGQAATRDLEEAAKNPSNVRRMTRNG